MAILKGIPDGHTLKARRWKWLEMEEESGATLGTGFIFNTAGTRYWVYMNTSGALQYHTSEPAAVDSDGTAVATAASGVTLDTAFDAGKLINDSDATGAANAFSVGGAGVDDKVEIYHDATDGYINCRAGDLHITAVGADINFANENLVTTGTLGAGAITGTSFVIGANTLTTTEWAFLDAIDQSVATTDSPTFAAASLGTGELTAGSINRAANDLTLEIAGAAIVTINSTDVTLAKPLALGANALTSTATITTTGKITADGGFELGADNVKLTIGAADASASYIQYDGANLEFYDATAGGPFNLTQLLAGTPLNPIVTGDLTISDGLFDWAYGTNAPSTWGFASNTTGDVIDLSADALTSGSVFDIDVDTGDYTGNIIDINADNIGTGCFIHLDTDETTGFTGEYVEFISNDTDVDVTIKRFGATVLRGDAGGTAVMTFTEGDLIMTDGRITQACDSDDGNTFSKNIAAGSASLMKLTVTAANDTCAALEIDNNATSSGKGIAIAHDGDGSAIEITAGVARDGNAIDIVMTNFLDEQAMTVTGDITGTAGEGIIDIDLGAGVLATTACGLQIQGSGDHVAGSHLVYLLYDTGQLSAASADGYMLNITDSSTAQPGSYAVYIAGGNNEALHVDSGAVLVDETVTASGGFVSTIADNGGVACLTITNDDVTGDENGITLVMKIANAGDAINIDHNDTGAGDGIVIDTEAVSGFGLKIDAVNTSNQSAIITMVPGGASTANILKLASTGANATTGAGLLIDHDGVASGTALQIDRDGSDAGNDIDAITIDVDNANTGDQIALKINMVNETKSHFVDFETDMTNWASTVDPAAHAGTDGWIKIKMGANDRYIPIYAAA